MQPKPNLGVVDVDRQQAFRWTKVERKIRKNIHSSFIITILFNRIRKISPYDLTTSTFFHTFVCGNQLKSNKMKADQILYKELKRLYEECTGLIDKLNDQYKTHLCNNNFEYIIKYSNGQNEKIDLLELLMIINSQIKLHLDLNETHITSVNFYTQFQSQFDLGSYNKGVEYFIQDGYEGVQRRVTDVDSLKREFSINNCMISMGLVPINLASNAKKYMPSDTKVNVVLLKTTKRNIITITNLAPKNEDKNLDKLTEEGYRGDNSSEMAGMGLGLSQIKSIVEMHQSLIDSTIDIAQSNKIEAIVDGIEYTWFSVTITYLRDISNQEVNHSLDGFISRLPLVIAHNMVDIIANLFVVADKLPRLWFHDKNDPIKKNYIKSIQRFKLAIERMQECIKLYLYIRNNYSTQYLQGNKCHIAIGQFFKEELNNLITHQYSHKSINLDIIDGSSSKLVETYSAVYPMLYGLCDLFLSKSPKDTDFHVEMDDTGITLSSDNFDFKRLIYNDLILKDPNEEDISRIRSHMYFQVLRECNMDLEIDNNTLNISL